MAVRIGILLDVSGSMKRSASGLEHEILPGGVRQSSWSHSIFRVIDQLVKHDVSSENQVFALGYGASRKPDVFDLLKVMRIVSELSGTKSEIINASLEILERNGAPFVTEWASSGDISRHVSEDEARFFLLMFKKNTKSFTRRFVEECLPLACRYRSTTWSATAAEHRTWVTWIPVVSWAIENRTQTATRESIKETFQKGKKLLKEICSKGYGIEKNDEEPDIWFEIANGLSSDAIVDVHKASEILHGCVDKKNLTDDEVQEVLKKVEPFIYGGTPMIAALGEAKKLMSLRQHEHHKKVLFVVSDGEPADVLNTLPDLSGVHVVSCYITNSHIAEPRRLYSNKCQDWDKGAKFMFDMSSSVKTHSLPRTMFVKLNDRKWEIDMENDETKLFLQANNPDFLMEVCDFAKNIVCFQETLSDLLCSIELDQYIKEVNEDFLPEEQQGETCYAHASATVIHLATKSRVGKEGDCPEFFDLRAEIIDEYKRNGANTLKVLKKFCPRFGLQCKDLENNTREALKAVAAKRPVVARYRLTRSERKIFHLFYRQNPTGTLTKNDLDISKRRHRKPETVGHAVVLTGFNSKGLILMNSYGTSWPSAKAGGFFSVENADVLGMTFIDVSFDNLTESEKEAHRHLGARRAQKLMSSLKGLHDADYECPLCRKSSLVSTFIGKLDRVKCPKCKKEFDTNREDAHDLVLNIYLTSLRCFD